MRKTGPRRPGPRSLSGFPPGLGLALVGVGGGCLHAVLGTVLDLGERGHRHALHELAVGVHLVVLVGEHAVVSLAAVDLVHLAVPDPEAVGARVSEELVAGGIAGVALVARRWRRTGVAAAAPEPRLSSEDERRLDAELAAFDR